MSRIFFRQICGDNGVIWEGEGSHKSNYSKITSLINVEKEILKNKKLDLIL
jgi:hypothetical protein